MLFVHRCHRHSTPSPISFLSVHFLVPFVGQCTCFDLIASSLPPPPSSPLIRQPSRSLTSLPSASAQWPPTAPLLHRPPGFFSGNYSRRSRPHILTSLPISPTPTSLLWSHPFSNPPLFFYYEFVSSDALSFPLLYLFAASVIWMLFLAL